MLIPDLILLLAVVALALWRLSAPAWRPRLRAAPAASALLLAIAQWALCGFTWQDGPAYPTILLSALPPLRTGRVRRVPGRFGLVLLAAGCVGVWILPAVPTLPMPSGRYPVATLVYRWTDPARDEPHTSDPADRRSVIVQAWYPTQYRGAGKGGAHTPYLDGIGRMPRGVGAMLGMLVNRYGQIDTHAAPGAALASHAEPWPAVIFSPGYGAPRAIYTGLAMQLASRGFVVLVLDHPYEAAVTELPDGRVVGTRELVLPGERNRIGYMMREQARRAGDIRFVIDQLARPGTMASLSGRIDTTRVAVIGHSFGGAAAMAASSEDRRVVAAVNIDGTPYGDLPDRRLTRPLLLVESDLAEVPHGAFFIAGNRRLLAHAAAPSYRYEIGHADHFSFTDLPFFLAPPGRWLLAQVVGGSRGPAATQQATTDLIAAFLSGPLTGTPAGLTAVARRYPGVRGGAVRKATDRP